MKARADNFRNGKPYDEIGKILSQSIAKNVEAGGRPRWKPRKYSYPHPILDKTGTMRDAAEQTSLKWIHRTTEHIDQVKSTDYGEVHQYKGVRTYIGGSVKYIIRRFVVVQPQEQTRMRNALRKAFLQE